MDTENILLAAILWICAGTFLGIAAWARSRRDPMHFWAGDTVPPERIRDIPAYNRACAKMWGAYGGLWVLSGAIALVWPGAAGVLTLTACFAGIPVLIAIYRSIYAKYKR